MKDACSMMYSRRSAPVKQLVILVHNHHPSRNTKHQLTHANDNAETARTAPSYILRCIAYSSSASSTVARGGRCVTSPVATGAASEPVGLGAESAATGAWWGCSSSTISSTCPGW